MTWNTPANIGRLVLILAVAAVSSWVTKGCTSGGGDPDRMTVQMVQRTYQPADVVAPTDPDTVKVYETPDTTRTDCIEVPAWLATTPPQGQTQQQDSTELGDQIPASSQSDSLRGRGTSVGMRAAPRLRATLAGLPYVITPTTNGRPSLSVGSKQVTLSALDPRDGSGLTYTYDIPQPTWSLGAGATVGASARAALATTDVLLTRHYDDFRLSLGPTAMTVVTEGGYEAQAALTIHLHTTLWSR